MASTSSSFPGLLNHKMLQASSKLCCSRTAKENARKLNASPNSRTIFTSNEYHITWTKFENAAVFFQKFICSEKQASKLGCTLYMNTSKVMFGLLYLSQNWSIFPILCNYAIFLLIMRSDAARGQLCEIASVHNIRSPVTCTQSNPYMYVSWLKNDHYVSSFVDITNAK